ncbi:MAG: DUF72 domain-containing protein [Fidelibacterota bacterium]|nr:MAG: DUF72 domain-containing protein [Candidatus Neomarinimicrobiota bacterium]
MHIGTSGWTYDDWQGRFYPDDVKGTARLEYYARRFNTVELNASFYRVPTEPMVASWNRRLPPDFHMVVKGSRLITHRRKLVNVDESLDFFLGRIRPLQTLKVILWQLPPSLHMDLPRLEDFLARLPAWTRHAVEFRHASWWDDQVADTLARHKAAFVAVSMGGLSDTIIPTTDLLYLRFHGPAEAIYQYDYPDEELTVWAERVRPYLPDRTLYAFFNNDFHANAPHNAVTFQSLLNPAGAPTD